MYDQWVIGGTDIDRACHLCEVFRGKIYRLTPSVWKKSRYSFFFFFFFFGESYFFFKTPCGFFILGVGGDGPCCPLVRGFVPYCDCLLPFGEVTAGKCCYARSVGLSLYRTRYGRWPYPLKPRWL